MAVQVGGVGAMTFTTQQIRAFQKLLVDARRKRGLTQTQAAQEIGVSQTLISSLERGPHNGMRVGELFRVLAFYGIEPNTVARILGYIDEGTKTEEQNEQLQRMIHLLAGVPDPVADFAFQALELMIRGAIGGA